MFGHAQVNYPQKRNSTEPDSNVKRKRALNIQTRVCTTPPAPNAVGEGSVAPQSRKGRTFKGEMP